MEKKHVELGFDIDERVLHSKSGVNGRIVSIEIQKFNGKYYLIYSMVGDGRFSDFAVKGHEIEFKKV
jgi:hypothetical protein